MVHNLVVSLASWLQVLAVDSPLCIPDPEVCMNASQLIVSKGYPCEEYTVQTADGFLLGLQRIPHGRHDTIRSRDDTLRSREVVFLQHGLLCSSTNWITNHANQSFAFILADAGFDVWLGNVRGNTYGRRHVRYSPKDAQFWDWSWDEMAKYDLPAMIDFVLHKTNEKSLYYVGHSQGTLMAFAHASQNPLFANKIKTFFAMGPVATTAHIKGPLRLLAYFSREIQDLLWIFGVREFLPNSEIIKFLGSTVCDIKTRIFCEDILFTVAGFDEKQLNIMVRSGDFSMYDYGSASKNHDHYGQNTPPLYNLSKVHIPMVLLSAANDWLADPKDVKWLASQLPNIVKQVEIADWDHLDFVWGLDAPRIVYEPIIKMMKRCPTG